MSGISIYPDYVATQSKATTNERNYGSLYINYIHVLVQLPQHLYFIADMWEHKDDDENIYNDLCTGQLVSN